MVVGPNCNGLDQSAKLGYTDELHTTVPNPRAMTIRQVSINNMIDVVYNILVMSSDTTVAHPTVFGSERFTSLIGDVRASLFDRQIH